MRGTPTWVRSTPIWALWLAAYGLAIFGLIV
jgi:hypothetical protein